MGSMSIWHWIIVLAVVLLLFGGRLSDLLGRKWVFTGGLIGFAAASAAARAAASSRTRCFSRAFCSSR